MKDGRDVPLLKFCFDCPLRDPPKSTTDFPACTSANLTNLLSFTHFCSFISIPSLFFWSIIPQHCPPPQTAHLLLVLSSLSANLIGPNASRSLRDQGRIRTTLMANSLSCSPPPLPHPPPLQTPSPSHTPNPLPTTWGRCWSNTEEDAAPAGWRQRVVTLSGDAAPETQHHCWRVHLSRRPLGRNSTTALTGVDIQTPSPSSYPPPRPNHLPYTHTSEMKVESFLINTINH